MRPECQGFIAAEAPDLVIDVGAGLPHVMFYMVADTDGVLVVRGPDGTIYCNDDFEGTHPGIVIRDPAPGPYAVFAGAFEENARSLATLGVTLTSPQWVMDRVH